MNLDVVMENFMMRLFIESINALETPDWQWPDSWNATKQQHFLKQSMNYAGKHELYEQCAIIKKIQDQHDAE
jgi:hypothetical protein